MIRNTLALVSFLLAAILLPGISSAGPNCPLASGSETVWTIDINGDPNNPAATSACNDKQASDCSIYGVINKINQLLAVQCTSDQLSSATLHLKFVPGITSITVPKEEQILLAPPVDLKKIIIDGDLGNGGRVVFNGATDSTKVLFYLKCPLVSEQCSNIDDFTDVELKNADFFGGTAGVYFNYAGTKGGDISISNVKISNSNHWGVNIYGAKDFALNVSSLELVGNKMTEAFHVMNSSVKDGQLDGIKIEQLKTAGNYGLIFKDGTVEKLGIKNSNITSYSAMQFTNGTYNNVEFRNDTLNFGGYGLYFSGYGENISVVDSNLAGSNTSIIGVFLKSTSGLTNVSIKSDAGQLKISGVKKGIHINGIVTDVKVDGVTIADTSSNAIFVETITNIEEPKKISYNNVKFENVVEQNNVVKLISNTANAFANSVTDPIATNLGLDTPPLTSKKISLTRDETKPQWLMIKFDYFKDCSEMELFLKKGMSLYPIKVDSFGFELANCNSAGICNYSAETTFDKEHVSAYNNEDLDGLAVRLAMTCNANTSMISPEQKLIDANWLGTEKITVDKVSSDDASLSACLDEIDGDCSLRGAIAYVKAKRDAGKKHHIKIVFKDGLGDVRLNSTLKINTSNIDIDGAGKQLVTPGEDFNAVALMWVTEKDVVLSSLSVDGSNKAANGIYISGENFAVNNVKFLNMTKNGAVADSVLLGGVEIYGPLFNNILNNGVFLNKPTTPAHITSVTIEGSSFPKKVLEFGGATPSKAPDIIKAVDFDLVAKPMTAVVYGSFDKKFEVVEAYIGFSKYPEPVLLKSIGEYTPTYVDGKMFYITVALPDYEKTQMVDWGELDLYMIGQQKVGAVYASTNLSAPVAVYKNLNTLDTDSDKIFDINDNAPLVANSDQADLDGDGIGDVTDDDMDGDGVLNVADNCAAVKNADQLDTDADGLGDTCDDDADGDGVANASDNCPYNFNPDQATFIAEGADGAMCVADADKDGVRDDKDNCVGIANADQFDAEGDGKGDACDDDIDGDGLLNASDNCPFASNADQVDADNDNLGDICDSEPGITPPPPEQPAEGGGCSCTMCRH